MRCNVYVIAGYEAPSKIGISVNPEKRCKQLRQGNRLPLRVIKAWGFPSTADAYIVEHNIHLALADRRTNGEWFDLVPDEAVSAVAKCVEEFGGGGPVIKLYHGDTRPSRIPGVGMFAYQMHRIEQTEALEAIAGRRFTRAEVQALKAEGKIWP